MSQGSSFRYLNRLSARSNYQTFSFGRFERNGQSPVPVGSSSHRSTFSTSSCARTDARRSPINSLDKDRSSNASSVDLDQLENGSLEIDEPTNNSTIHPSFPSPSSPPPSSPPPSAPPPSSSSQPHSLSWPSAPQPVSSSQPIPLSFAPSSPPPPRASLSRSNLTPSFDSFSSHSPPQSKATCHQASEKSSTSSAPLFVQTLLVAPTNANPPSASPSEAAIPKSIGQQLIDRQNDPVALRRLANWLMQDRHREKDFKDWGLICRMCPPDLAIRMLSSPHAYGLKPMQKSPIISSQVYHLRSVISKLVLSHPQSSASSLSTSNAENTSYNLMHNPSKLIPLLNQLIKLSELYLPGDPYILLLALRAYASFPGIGDSGRARVIELIHTNQASWWPDPSFNPMDSDHEGSRTARSPSLNFKALSISLKNQRFEDVNRHRLTDLDAWTILKQVDRLRLLADLSLEVCSSWDRQPVPAPLQKQRLRLLRPLQQLERLSDAPPLSDHTPSSTSSETETAHRPAIVPYEQIARFVTPALYQAPTDPIVLLFSMYLLHLTSVPGDAPLRTLSAQALGPNGVEREVRGGFESTKEMSETYRLMKKAISVLKNVWGQEGEVLWEVIKEDLRSQNYIRPHKRTSRHSKKEKSL
ncbi:hypothetical protein [Phaffia rhodozyma]|uniref:Uncharacterized protein n=1 Tax=Phaffia rhodozyma TaxID=264483 RepID=A0A0F7SF71_PHARH|nr:hypothetical protein [Phaffia rhodozyma]